MLPRIPSEDPTAWEKHDEFCEELVEGAGTRYAPYLPEILSKESVKKEILWLIEEGRQEEYRNTFLLLKNVTDQG